MPGFDRVKCSEWRFLNELKRELKAEADGTGNLPLGKELNIMITRREFMRDAALLGAAGALGPVSAAFAAEPPPETTRIRLPFQPTVCNAPMHLAEELLRGEGFTDVRYVKVAGTGGRNRALAEGRVDLAMGFVTPMIVMIDEGAPIIMLAGIHPGCLELFAAKDIRTIRDLKGKTVSIPQYNGSQHLFLVAMISHVGVDPRRDIKWVEQRAEEGLRSLSAGEVAGLICSPPVSTEARDRKIGHVIANTTTDRPWSQYFCCVLMAQREFGAKFPVATRRALRAFLKSTEICSARPDEAARMLVKQGLTKRYDYALQGLKEIPYARWRDFDAADSMRYYALRLKENGFIKSDPAKMVARSTDFRFFNELKKELKT